MVHGRLRITCTPIHVMQTGLFKDGFAGRNGRKLSKILVQELQAIPLVPTLQCTACIWYFSSHINSYISKLAFQAYLILELHLST